MKELKIDPVTRVEGHLKIETKIEDNSIREAKSSGTMFRGFEQILSERDPSDALRITQRVCGVCPTAHATASSLALEDAFDIKDNVPKNGRILKNLMLGSNFIQSHVLHFYHLAALDYLNPEVLKGYSGSNKEIDALANHLRSTDGSPFSPQYEGDYRLDTETSTDFCHDYLKGLEIRKKAHELLAIFGGKMPHNMGTIPGGTTKPPDLESINKFQSRLKEIRSFIDNKYLPGALALVKTYRDYFEIGKGTDTFLEYGGFYLDKIRGTPQNTPSGFLGGIYWEEPDKLEEVDLSKITEEVTYSWYTDPSSGHPSSAKAKTDSDKKEAYSWVKAPRYQGQPCEVGPAARMIINYKQGNQPLKEKIDQVLTDLDLKILDLASVAGRHLSRALECKHVADLMFEWSQELEPGDPSCADFETPKEGEGVGTTSAPRGTLGHWIRIKDGKIANYQLVVPTTWNASPQDDQGKSGPIEQALVGTEINDEKNPIEAARVVRSFDPCMACAVH